jgi:microcystin-dependent protein
VRGLGLSGYVSSLSLSSTVQGLGSALYVSTTHLGNSLMSTVQGLGNVSYVSSLSLTSTVQGLGLSGYVSSLSLRSTVQGLGNVSYVSSLSLRSTVQGLGTFYVSSFNNILSISSQLFVASSIGVGCNLPRYNLDVNGSINASQDIRVNNIPISVGSTPVGSITMYAGTTAPTNWLICNGQALAVASYNELYIVIGYFFGGSGTVFNIPNLGGRVPVGRGSSGGFSYPLAQTGGAETHTLTINEMPSHSHGGITNAFLNFFTPNDGAPVPQSIYSGITAPAGGGLPHNNMQPYIVLNYMIRAFP